MLKIKLDYKRLEILNTFLWVLKENQLLTFGEWRESESAQCLIYQNLLNEELKKKILKFFEEGIVVCRT